MTSSQGSEQPTSQAAGANPAGKGAAEVVAEEAVCHCQSGEGQGAGQGAPAAAEEDAG